MPIVDKGSYDVLEMNHAELAQELQDTMDSPVPLYIWGPPGIGKSVITMEVARATAARKHKFFIDWNRSSKELKRALWAGELNANLLVPMVPPKKDAGGSSDEAALKVSFAYPNGGLALKRLEDKKPVRTGDCFIFADYRLSQRDPSDLNGIPGLGDSEFVEWRPTLLFSVLSRPDAKGMLFFDEIPQALPIVQNAAYQLIQDRCCGEISFSDDIVVIAAGNRITDGGSQFQIPPALANRFTHVELMAPNIEMWVKWGIAHGIDDRILSFLQFKTSYLMDSMEEVRKTRAMAWCSPRSWERASDKIRGLRGNDKSAVHLIYNKVAMAVGKDRATEFRAFIRTTISLNIKEILGNPESVSKLDISIKWALISAVADYYKADKKYLNDIIKLCDYLDPDFSVSMLRMMQRYDMLKFATRLMKCPNKNSILPFMKYFGGD